MPDTILDRMIRRQIDAVSNLSEAVQHHIVERIPVTDPIFRPGSAKYFKLIREMREAWIAGHVEDDLIDPWVMSTDLGEWGLYEGRKVPLDFPIPLKIELREAFADHYGDAHGKWVRLSHEDLYNHPEIYSELYDIIDLSYKYIGGHANYISPETIAADKDIAAFAFINADDDPALDAAKLYKKTDFGLKSIASATDGSKPAKDMLKAKMRDELSSDGYYAEVSGAAAGAALKMGVPIVDDESLVRTVLGGKSIRWHGVHPMGEFPGTNGWYSRKIGGEDHIKIMVGRPLIDRLDEAEYKGRDVSLGKPFRVSGGGHKFAVYVRDPKTGNVKKVQFGAPGLKVKLKDPERRKSFAARHRCESKTDKTTPGYWACRIGRYPKLFGGDNYYKWW